MKANSKMKTTWKWTWTGHQKSILPKNWRGPRNEDNINNMKTTWELKTIFNWKQSQNEYNLQKWQQPQNEDNRKTKDNLKKKDTKNLRQSQNLYEVGDRGPGS